MLNFLIYNFTNVGSIIEFILISLLLIALSVLIIIFSKKIILSIIISSLSAASILALGVLTPAAMLIKRLTDKGGSEFQTKKEIKEQLIKEGIIS